MDAAKIDERADVVTYLMMLSSAAAMDAARVKEGRERDGTIATVLEDFDIDSEMLASFFETVADMIVLGQHADASKDVTVYGTMNGGEPLAVREIIVLGAR